MKTLEGKRILVTGGIGSLGQTLVKRLLAGELGKPARVTVFSRDEAKQHYKSLPNRTASSVLLQLFLSLHSCLWLLIYGFSNYKAREII